MSEPTPSPDLLDLKMMPAWVNDSAGTKDYSNFEGETERSFDRDGRSSSRGGGGGRRDERPRGPRRETREGGGGRGPGGPGQGPRRPAGPRSDSRRPDRRDEQRAPREAPLPLPQVEVRFLPHPPALESVLAQIKTGAVTYSVFALARLFLDKPERYDVRLKAAEGAVLHQLGENGPVATDQRLLEASAFASARDEYYAVEQTQTEPLKGNFSNVARCRLSGTLLGPTNHHAYQPQLRSLYEQRFSRRMSFQDYQRQVEIVSDPEVVEQWKEQARSITTYKTKGQDPELSFKTEAEAERHFRQTHLPTLLRSEQELTVDGVLSRRMGDRGLGRLIENSWATEVRSPSKMMQELSAALRSAGLNIFRHRKGMLFVSPYRIRVFGHERSGVSACINGILEKLTESPGINRKQLAEKMAMAEGEAEMERAKRALASDLHWLIHEGYVIEFNDGTLDLPRAKQPSGEGKPDKAEPTDAGEASAETPVAASETEPAPVSKDASAAAEQPIEAVTETADAADAPEPIAAEKAPLPTEAPKPVLEEAPKEDSQTVEPAPGEAKEA